MMLATETRGSGFPVILEHHCVLKSSSGLPNLAPGHSKFCKPLSVLNSFLPEIPKVESGFPQICMANYNSQLKITHIIKRYLPGTLLNALGVFSYLSLIINY